MTPDKASDVAFSVLRDLYTLEDGDGVQLDPQSLRQRIQQIHKGLSAEMEFAAIASWLGRSTLLTQPDQVLHNDGSYGVPDFMCVVRRGGGSLAFLVEVKTNQVDELKWGEKYHSKMTKFAELLKLPLLVAWKRHGLWLLNDVSQFEKREKSHFLPFDVAIKNNLMGVLFGNVWIKLREDFRMEFRMEITGDSDEPADEEGKATLPCVIREAGYFTWKGKVAKDLSSIMFRLLVTKSLEPRVERQGRNVVEVFPADAESMFNSSDILFASLTWNKPEGAEVDWLAEIRRGLPKSSENLRESLKDALEAGAIQYIFDQQPHVFPPYLVKAAQGAEG